MNGPMEIGKGGWRTLLSSLHEPPSQSSVEALKGNFVLNMPEYRYSLPAVVETKPKQEEEAKDKRRYKCQLCPFTSHVNQRFQRHKEAHNQTNGLQCPHCSYKNISTRVIKRHISLHTNPEGLTKDANTMDSEGQQKEKETSESINRGLQVNLCKQAISARPRFARSGCRGAPAKEFASILEQKASNKFMVCGDDTMESSSDSVTTESLLTSSSAMMRCTDLDCPYEDNDPTQYSLHADMHAPGKRPLTCTMCTYSCFAPEALYIHLDLHTAGQEVFKKITSASAPRLSQHLIKRVNQNQDEWMKPRLRKQKNATDLYCSKCGFYCMSKLSFDKHVQMHGTAGYFVCKLCDYASNTYNVVHFHEIHHHLDQPLTDSTNAATLKPEATKENIFGPEAQSCHCKEALSNAFQCCFCSVRCRLSLDADR